VAGATAVTGADAPSSAPDIAPSRAAPSTGPAIDTVTLQVASFAARPNAERALAMLDAAGIRDARLLDAIAAGKQVWRLRVGPVEKARVAELASQVAGLGFGPPNVVRE